MSDDIEVHFDPERGHLSLSCGETAFVRLRDLIFTEASVPEIVGPPLIAVWHIEVESAPAVIASRRGRGLRLATLGVDLIIVAGFLVFVVGLWTILRWVLQRLA